MISAYKHIKKRYVTYYLCCIIVFSNNSYAQSINVLHLDDVLESYCLESTEAKLLKLNHNNATLELENFKLSSLPTMSFNLNPLSFSQSIVSLQDPTSGNFHYTNSFNNNSSAGLVIKQPLNFLGGSLQLSSSLNMLNEFSTNRSTFSSVPLRLSYSQSIIGGAKMYKFDKQINRLKGENLSAATKSKYYSIQKRCVELYMKVLVCDLFLANSKINMGIADTVYYISNTKKSIGEITEQDYLQSEIQYEQSKVEVINTKIQYDKALRELLIYLNLDGGNYAVVMPRNVFLKNIDVNDALAVAEMHGPQFKEYEIQKAQAERELYGAKLQKGFNAEINLSFGLNQYGEQFYLAYQKPSTQQSFMMGMRIPIVDWGVQKNSYTMAKNRHEISMSNTEMQEKNTEEYLRTIVEQYNYNVQVVDVVKRQSELALKQYRLTVRLLGSGHNTFFELATASKQYIDAERVYLEQLSLMWINYYTIRSLTLTNY